MKKLFYLILAVFALCISACNDDDNVNDGNMEAVTDVSATPFIGSVILKFKVPTSDNYYYTLITYKNSKGKTKHYKAGPDDLDTISGYCQTTIGGFTDTDSHDFTLEACTPHGNHSKKVTVSASPMSTTEAKDYVLGTVSIAPSDESGIIKWTNESGVPVTLIVNYTDVESNAVTNKINATSTGSAVLSNIKPQVETEISVTAQNTGDEETTQTKEFTIVASGNVDDIIYPNIEYITYNLGTSNLEEITQPNKNNPYEYEIKTTGSDPFCSINPLKGAKAGAVFKMRYKATADFIMEFFWCNAGGGAAGGRSTSAIIKASNTWTTFTYDYSAAMTQHSWAGNAGDFFRMDMGDNPNVVIDVRNMHWEKK